MEVNVRAVTAFCAEHGPVLPPDFRCDMSRVGSIRRRWETAAKQYKEETGLDVYEALKEHEAMLRSRNHVPELYVERRFESGAPSYLIVK